MEIYPISRDGVTSLIFKEKHSRHQLVFDLRLEGNQPSLRGYWSGIGGFGGGLDMKNDMLWSYFLSRLNKSVEKGQLEFSNAGN